MFPILIRIGEFTIRTYGAIVAIAVITGIFISMHYATKYKGIDEDTFINMAIWLIVGGILGARIFWIFTSPWVDYYLQNPWHIVAIWEGGLSFEGMLAGGIIASAIVTRRYKTSFFKLLDSAAPGVAAGYGIGKWACFFNGCCHGIEATASWWPKFFPFVTVFKNPLSECEILNTPLYSAQILNSLGGWITFIVLVSFIRKRKLRYHGQIFVLFSFVFSTFLFFIEYIRYIPTRFLSLTPNQWGAIAFIVSGIVLDRILRIRAPVTEIKENKTEGEP